MLKLMNYMNLDRHPVQLSFRKDRTQEFAEVYHAHQGMELLYVHQGHGQVVVERQIFELGPGSLFMFRPYQLHRVNMTDLQAHPYVRSLFVFEPRVLEAALHPFPALLASFRHLWTQPAASPQLLKPGADGLGPWLQAYAEGLVDPSLEAQLVFLVALLQRIQPLLTGSGDEAAAAGRSPASRTAEAILAWIDEHYAEPFDLSRLALHVHLTPNHVSALFRRAVGSSITEYLTAHRIRSACRLLSQTDDPVQRIGEAVGLSNFSYFCQAFKKHVGLSPLQYRNAR